MSNHDHDLQVRDWRWIILLAVIIYAGLLGVGAMLGGRAITQHLLQVMGVPALDPAFIDIRGVAGWCEASAVGKNPSLETTYITIPGEKPVLDFQMNYSPLVLTLGYLGLDQQHAPAWALILALLYISSLWCLCGPCTARQAYLWGVLLLSPASVLVVERGNLDMLLFALIVMALLLRKQPFGASAVILIAGLIKFFPIGALPAIWREGGNRNRAAAFLGATLFLMFLFFLRSRLGMIGTSLTGQYQSAFGCGVIADLLRHYGILANGNYGITRGALDVLGVTLLSIASVLGFFSSQAITQHVVSDRKQYAFFLTAPFMLALFVLGNQMDYKWIFFLPMVPAVLELLDSPDLMESGISKMWFGGILAYSYWTFFSDEGSLRNAFLKQVVMWGVMAMTAFLASRIWRKCREL
jgi:hypothetical protein